MSCTCRARLFASAPRATPPRVVSFARAFASSRSPRAAAVAASPSPPPPSTSAAPNSTPSISSCPPGTVLAGLNYLKDESPVVSKPDSDYPAWLWSLASPASPSEASTSAASAKNKSKKSSSSASSQASTGVEQNLQDLARRKKALKLEGRKAIKASNALRG